MSKSVIWKKEKPIAHRGLFDNLSGVPENSLKAFDLAAAAGYPIETDVRMLSCGTLVLFHDETFDRMIGRTGSVHDVEYKDISGFKLLNTEEGIPTFGEMLSVVDGRVPIMIELKNERKVPRLGDALVKLLESYSGRYSVHSFDPGDVEWFVGNAPSITRGMVFEYFTEEEYSYAERVVKPDFMVFYRGNIPPGKVEACRGAGKSVLVYTSKSAKEHEAMLKVCDNVVFEGDRP